MEVKKNCKFQTMETVGLVIGVIVWLFVDVFLGLRIKKLKSSKKRKNIYFVLYAVNVLFALSAVMLALMVY